jgi:ankyrin repeat protein
MEVYNAVGLGDIALVEVRYAHARNRSNAPCPRGELQELLRSKAEINYKDGEDGDSPLHSAAIRGDVAVADLLIRNAANISATNDIG